MKQKLSSGLLVCFLLFGLFSQSQTVKGKITDDKGAPLQGVSIVEKGTKNGATSDSAGIYSISVRKPNTTLSFSSIGFVDKEISVKGQTSINAVLAVSNTDLND